MFRATLPRNRRIVRLIVALILFFCALAGTWIAPGAGLHAGVPPTGNGINLCAEVAYDAGFTGSALINAVAIGYAESGCAPSANNSNTYYGIWQISTSHGYSVSCLQNAQCNANAAYSISSKGSNWCQWQTWSGAGCSGGGYDDAYAQYTTTASTAISNLFGTATTGYYNQADGSCHFRNDQPAPYTCGPSNSPTAFPIEGDWLGSGKFSTGYYNQSDGSFHFQGDQISPFVGGPVGDTSVFPFAGDFSGTGKWTVGWYRQSDGSFHFDQNGPSSFKDGPAGDDSVFPIAGAWGSTGAVWTVGWYRQSDGSFHFQNDAPGPFTLGPAGNLNVYPFAGDWNATGLSYVGWYRQSDGSCHFESGPNPYSCGPDSSYSAYPMAGEWTKD